MAIETQSAPAPALSISSRHSEAAIFGAVLLLAAGLRLVPILVTPSLNWADEIFQATEQAHRLVYGTGLVPWEFQLGARSWMFPGVIAGLMEAARLLGDGPAYYLPVIAAAFAALATAPVVCCYLWCRRAFGVSGAIVGGLFVAVAPELVYFGARTLMDVVAGHLLIIALYVIDPGYPVASRRRAFVAGILLGLLFVLRIQLAPVLALLGLWALWRLPRTSLMPAIVGAVGAVLFVAVFDMLTLGAPLASVWRYVSYNVFYDVSSTFGTAPWSFYLTGEFGIWGGAIAVVLALALLGARRLPLLLIYALTIVATHSAIAHKEYRFIYPAIVLITVLAGIGLAQLAAWSRDWLTAKGATRAVAVLLPAGLLLGYWGALAFGVWTGPTLAALRDLGHDNLTAAAYVAQAPDVCGIGLYGRDGEDWGWSGGYTYLHRSVPMYWPKDEAEFAATAPGFNTLIAVKPPPAGSGFVTRQCFGAVCVAERPGQCARVPMMAMPFPKPIESLAPAAAESAR